VLTKLVRFNSLIRKKEGEKYSKIKQAFWIIVILMAVAIDIIILIRGPSITGQYMVINYIKNETAGIGAAFMENVSEDAGGKIYTVHINATQQTRRWKAYIGNVTGSYVLEDGAGSKVYEWSSVTSVTGQVFVTRNDTSPNWGNINCTWAFAGSMDNNNDRSLEEEENTALNHASPDDNISATFHYMNHTSFWVGSVQIPANYCWNLNPYIANTSQSDSAYADTFDELLLYENSTGIIYTAQIEMEQPGYMSDISGGATYDFQVLLPEYSGPTFESSTAYYFYLELD